MTRADYLGQDPNKTYDRFYQINPQTGEVMQRGPSDSRTIPDFKKDERRTWASF